MTLQNYRKLISFLNTRIADGDPESDRETARQHASTLREEDLAALIGEIRDFRQRVTPDLTELGTEANRWFSDTDEASAWLGLMESALEGGASKAEAMVVVDFNGTPLNEDDSVTVIKDLKVKGGSSDLKRGTLIRKIRLTQDPGLIECRVDGSVLVLKTEFLKKA